jgi:hypothetical protein
MKGRKGHYSTGGKNEEIHGHGFLSRLAPLAAAQQSERLLAKITDPAHLEDLGEMLLECKDGAAWLNRVQTAAQRSGE